MGKVCDLYRGLETSKSVVLTVMNSLGSSFDKSYSGYLYDDA
jgi:hypothetical protein